MTRQTAVFRRFAAIFLAVAAFVSIFAADSANFNGFNAAQASPQEISAPEPAVETPTAASGPVAEDPAERKMFRKSVRGRGFPWYSSDDEKVVYLPPPEIKYREREVRPSTPSASGGFEGANALLTGAFAVLIVVLAALLIWALYEQYRNRGPRKKEADERANRVRRLETLAPEARARLDDLGAAARSAFESGDYRAAIVFYFSWLLVEMDKRFLVLMSKGKTNREYWFELESNPDAQTVYRDVMNVFERVYFGGRSIERAEFEAVWTLREPFEEILRRKDAEIAARLAAAEAARRKQPPKLDQFATGTARFAQNTQNKQSPPRSLLLALTLGAAASVALSGCVEPTWNDLYVEYNQGAPLTRQSVNSATAFSAYCGEKTRADDYEYSYCYLPNDGAKYETIVWFYRDNSPSALRLKSERSPRDAERTAAEDAFLRAPGVAENGRPFEAAEIYRFAEPSDAAAFAEKRAEIERWLNARPNRTFVFVAEGWRADADFWPAFKASAPAALPKSETTWVDGRLNQALVRRERFAEFDGGVWASASAQLREALQKSRAAAENAKKSPFGRTVRALAVLVRAASGDAKSAEKVAETWRRFEEKARSFDAESAEKIARERADERRKIEFDPEKSDLVDAIFDDPTVEGGCDDPDCPFCFPWAVASDDDGAFDGEPWFRVSFLPNATRLERFSGADDWTRRLPPTPTREYWATRSLEPLGETETLLSLDGEPFVVRRKVGESRFIALSSAAPLLNFSLLDPTNRVLAARLTDEFNPKGRTFVFVGSDFNIAEEEPEEEEPISPFSLSRLTPFSVLIWHLIALATLIVCWRFPIFGRPKRSVRERTNDFGKHVDAVAFLLERSDARRWSRKQIETFRAARDAGSAFVEPALCENSSPDKIEENGEPNAGRK